ncbi:hypothetical protein GCM10010399_09630 [Dactylosporangium fulvum]
MLRGGGWTRGGAAGSGHAMAGEPWTRSNKVCQGRCLTMLVPVAVQVRQSARRNSTDSRNLPSAAVGFSMDWMSLVDT